ncbi:complement factor B-like isoform X2 [Gymnodraco acuticeps]|uniref:C3/C5 convertase n=1 Tax=Gymnodraco acuticeps TaxID=8218 RepID=A0A6P8TEG1_GYMAC|nr:complement factor B-like isoform X2 [Gymnodraco acuticeps]
MGIAVHCSWLAALLCLHFFGQVCCDCTEEKMEIEGGHYTLTKQLQKGSMLIYHCPEDYYPYPVMTRLCQYDSRWVKAPRTFNPQRCRVVECPDPTVMEYGEVSPPQEKYFVHNETTYECYSGYTMRGSARRVCLSNGKWSGSTPICGRESGHSCADPGIPAGASRAGNIFGIDETVKYSCNSNLFLVGSSERVCLENGQWSNKEPACYYKHTYDTSLEISEAFGSSIRESLTTLESLNDTQSGKMIRISKNGTLNIYIAVDISESIEKEEVKKVKEAIITLIKKISSFTVNPNYEIAFFSSGFYEVVNILDFFNEQHVERNTIIDIVNNFKVDQKNTGTDLDLVFKNFLDKMAFIKQRVGTEQFKEHRHVIILFTDGAYNMGGSPVPTVARIKNMVYMNHTGEEETQSREAYLDIYIFATGKIIFDDDLQPLVTGIGPKHYFRIKAFDELQMTFDQIIDEEEVKGLCGLHKEYVVHDPTAQDARNNYPWWASIIIQNGGLSRKCIGSLVNPYFVLTAAHCFKFGDQQKHVKVEIDDGQGRVKKVKTFILHPKYDISGKTEEGVPEFYDYDVALIQLEDYVEISSSVRPICIPCTQETSDALQLVGVSTCKQQEELLLKKQLERVSFLTKKTESVVVEKDAHAKLGGLRDNCIKHALTAPNITATDPKVAVTDNFLCTGGRDPFRDHVACKGDSGGPVFKNYEQRTIQVALVSWGSKDLCQLGSVKVESDETSRDFHINLFRVVDFLKGILGNDKQDVYSTLKFLKD